MRVVEDLGAIRGPEDRPEAAFRQLQALPRQRSGRTERLVPEGAPQRTRGAGYPATTLGGCTAPGPGYALRDLAQIRAVHTDDVGRPGPYGAPLRRSYTRFRPDLLASARPRGRATVALGGPPSTPESSCPGYRLGVLLTAVTADLLLWRHWTARYSRIPATPSAALTSGLPSLAFMRSKALRMTSSIEARRRWRGARPAASAGSRRPRGRPRSGASPACTSTGRSRRRRRRSGTRRAG